MPRTRPLALVNARLIDPVGARELRGGILVADGAIADFGPQVSPQSLGSEAEVVDCGGDAVAPGLVDMRVFVGEPGQEHRETIASASAAAAAGGVTTVVATPDTEPPVDDPAVVDFILRRARDTARIRVLPAASITKGSKGNEISEMRLLREAGAVAFSEGSRSVRNSQVMRRAMSYSRDFDGLILHFAQDPDLGGGVANEGEYAMRLGLSGVPEEAEAIMLDRDLRLVALTGARYHAEIVSSPLSIEAMIRAKDAGLKATCGATVNHLCLNEGDIGDFRTFLKLSPPLRSEERRRALAMALKQGVIDVIVSDHVPQDVEAKRTPFAEAADGAVGLETLLAAALRLVHAGEIDLPVLWRAMSSRPAEILGLPQGRLARGAPADLVRFDPDEPWIVDPAQFKSRCRNTPFDEARLQGHVKATLVAGEFVPV